MALKIVTNEIAYCAKFLEYRAPVLVSGDDNVVCDGDDVVYTVMMKMMTCDRHQDSGKRRKREEEMIGGVSIPQSV